MENTLVSLREEAAKNVSKFSQQRELEEKKIQVIDEAISDIASLDNEIALVTGDVSKKRGRKAKVIKSAKAKIKRGPQLKNEQSLKEVTLKVLQEHPNGLPLSECVLEIRKTGYKSKANAIGFPKIVYQALYNLMNEEKKVVRDTESKAYKAVAAA